MSDTAEVHIVRVFTDAQGLFGNHLGVVLDGARYDAEAGSRLCAELGFSEVVLVDDRAAARLRVFTPKEELPLAGHPLVGTAWLLGRLAGTPVKIAAPGQGRRGRHLGGGRPHLDPRPAGRRPGMGHGPAGGGGSRRDAVGPARPRVRPSHVLGLDGRAEGHHARPLLRRPQRHPRGRGHRLGRDAPGRGAQATRRGAPGLGLGGRGPAARPRPGGSRSGGWSPRTGVRIVRF